MQAKKPTVSLFQLRWTTRDEVAGFLTRYLRETGPESAAFNLRDVVRSRAASLLALAAGTAQVPALRKLALDSRESVGVRLHSLRALARCGAGISGRQLEKLLAEDTLRRHPDDRFDRGDLLALARSRSAQLVVRRYMLNLAPKDRAELLMDASSESASTSSGLVDWLFSRWLQEDRFVLDGNRDRDCWNRQVIRCTLSRPESRSVLLGMWREALGSARTELLIDLQDEAQDWTFPEPLAPAEVEEVSRAFALPPEELVARFGRQSLLQMLAAQLLVEDHRLDRMERPGIFRSPRELRSLHLLRRWKDPGLDEWIAEHAIGRRLSTNIRAWLLWVLWERNRGLAAAALASQLQAGAPRIPQLLLAWIAEDPQESDRHLLRMVAPPDRPPHLQYLALCGLERLNEDGVEWRQRLTDWTQHPDPRLRIRALAAQAKRGSQTDWERLVDLAKTSIDLRVRAESVAALGELNAAHHLTFLSDTLLAEKCFHGSFRAPAAEEAALALAQDPSPRAITVLLRAYLRVDTHSLRDLLEHYLEALMKHEGNPPAPIKPSPTTNWRRATPWPWQEPTQSKA